jgi:hypothetical protein
MMTGFYFNTPSKEYFFVTKQTKRTAKLCKDVENYLIEDGCRFVWDGKYHGAFGNFSIHDKLQAATCEVKHTEKFGDYYDIKGDDFGGAGSFVSENKTKIVLL